LKGPYQFDFLSLAAGTKVRDLERALVNRVGRGAIMSLPITFTTRCCCFAD
jgi:hypothetical protein